MLKVSLGDKVFLSWIKGKGLDSGGIKIKYKNGILNAGPITTFSNYSIVSENRCFLIPKKFPIKKIDYPNDLHKKDIKFSFN